MSKVTPAALKAAMSGEIENFIAATTPGGIEAQEKRGQIEQSFRETLPLEGTEKREVWEKLGFVFGNTVDGIFVEAKFPEGWRKQPTDHSMWSNLLDDKGRTRGMIFYKAAFYDRSAHISLDPRIRIKNLMLDAKKEEIFDRDRGNYVKGKDRSERAFDWYVVMDYADNAVLFSSEPTQRVNYQDRANVEKQRADEEAQRQRCMEWLAANKPDYQDASAYWE